MKVTNTLRVERQLFSMLPPVINKPKTKITYPLVLPRLQIAIDAGCLSDYHYEAIDILSDLYTKAFFNTHFKGRLPKRYDKVFIDKIAQHYKLPTVNRFFQNASNQNVQTLNFRKDNIYSYKWMEKHSFNKIKNIFKETSQLRVTCAFNAVYYYEKSENIGWSGGKPKFKTKRHYGKQIFTTKEARIFDYKDGQNGSFSVLLLGSLGNLLMHNCMMLHHIYVPVEFYDLSRYSKFIYRRIIGNGFDKDHEYELSDIATWLNLKNGTITQLRGKIEVCLNELRDSGWIEYDAHKPSRSMHWYSIRKKRKMRSVTN